VDEDPYLGVLMSLGHHVQNATERPRGLRGWMLLFLVTALLVGVPGRGRR
jgi:hypothetical protein